MMVRKYLQLLRHRDELIREKKNLLYVFFYARSIQRDIDLTNERIKYFQDKIRKSPIAFKILRAKYQKIFANQVNIK